MPEADLHRETALVLAAGRGTRMGGPKALMQVRGQVWWREQRKRIEQWVMPQLWVISEAVHVVFGPQHDAPPIVVGDDTAPMFTSVLGGLRALAVDPPSAVYVLPIDVPACDVESVRALRQAGALPSVPVLATTKQRGHPVRLPWSFVETAILQHATDPAWCESARLDGLLRAHAVDVEVADQTVAVNLNTPEAVERWAST
ncbi:MAG: NTP transferase domain-containing protein [Phycisphaerales bacterium]|nr:NTP transferase domain-containing protein [Phycisphaerales bacterium]